MFLAQNPFNNVRSDSFSTLDEFNLPFVTRRLAKGFPVMEVGIKTGKMSEKKRIQKTPIWDISMLRIPAALPSGLRK